MICSGLVHWWWFCSVPCNLVLSSLSVRHTLCRDSPPLQEKRASEPKKDCKFHLNFLETHTEPWPHKPREPYIRISRLRMYVCVFGQMFYGSARWHLKGKRQWKTSLQDGRMWNEGGRGGGGEEANIPTVNQKNADSSTTTTFICSRNTEEKPERSLSELQDWRCFTLNVCRFELFLSLFFYYKYAERL